MLSLNTNESIETVQTHLSKWPYNVHVTMIYIAAVMRITRQFISGGGGCTNLAYINAHSRYNSYRIYSWNGQYGLWISSNNSLFGTVHKCIDEICIHYPLLLKNVLTFCNTIIEKYKKNQHTLWSIGISPLFCSSLMMSKRPRINQSHY